MINVHGRYEGENQELFRLRVCSMEEDQKDQNSQNV